MEVNSELRYGAVGFYDPDGDNLLGAHRRVCLFVLENYCKERRPHLKETWAMADELLARMPWKFIDKSTPISNGNNAYSILKQMLFARHEDTGVPLMVELASEINPAGEGRGLVSDLGSTCAMFGTKLPKEIALFANEYPHTLPAYIFCSMYSLQHPIPCALFKQLAGKLDHAGKDYRGFTALMMMVMQNATPELLDISLRSCQPASTLLNFQDQGGKTAAHYCAMLNRRQHLEVLVKYCADLQVKDNLGRTPADLAVARGHKVIAEMLGGFWPSKNSHFMLANREEADSFYSSIPSIFEPSVSEGDGDQDTGMAGIMRYLQRELPQLLELRPDSVVVVPSVFPEDCPFSQAMPQMQQGWEAEKQVFNCMKRVLNRIQAERPAGEVLLALYHGFRYGRVVTNASAKGATPKVDETAESEIDFIITCRNFKTGRQTGMVIEVKSGGSGQDAVRKRGGACDQLRKHFTSLKLALRAKLSWVRPCLILPNFPDAKHPMKVKIQAQENVQKELDKHGILGLFSSILGDDKNLYEWLTVQLLLEESLETDENYGNEPMRLLAWCLIKTMGTVVHHAAQHIEGQTALLTPPQKEALEHTGTKLLVLNGGYGTGKSFLAEEKMKQLHHRGWLSDTSKALFLVNSESKAFHAIMRERLKGLDNILVERVHRKDCSKVLQNMGKPGAYQHVKYVFIDHYDDFCSSTDGVGETAMAKELKLVSQRVKVIWLLVNANHTSGMMNLLDEHVGESLKEVKLDGRIRNTREISSVVYQACSHSWVDGKVDSSEPSGLPGPPVRILYFDPYQRLKGETYKRYVHTENESRYAAKVIRMLILDENIIPEDILVIHQNGGTGSRRLSEYLAFIASLDEYLVAAFQTAAGKQKTFSLAPLVLQFPWLPSHVSKSHHQYCPDQAIDFLTSIRQKWCSIDVDDAEAATADVIIGPDSVVMDDQEHPDFVKEITRARILRLWTLKVTHGLDAETTDAEFAALEDSLLQLKASSTTLEPLLHYRGRTQLRHVTVLPDLVVDGFESNVVVHINLERSYERTRPGGACMLSRAKVMSFILANYASKNHFSAEYPSLVEHTLFD